MYLLYILRGKSSILNKKECPSCYGQAIDLTWEKQLVIFLQDCYAEAAVKDIEVVKEDPPHNSSVPVYLKPWRKFGHKPSIVSFFAKSQRFSGNSLPNETQAFTMKTTKNVNNFNSTTNFSKLFVFVHENVNKKLSFAHCYFHTSAKCGKAEILDKTQKYSFFTPYSVGEPTD